MLAELTNTFAQIAEPALDQAGPLLKNSAFTSAMGSAAGGFLAILLFYGVRALISYYNSRPRQLRTYFCANYLNTGQSDESAGEIQHGMGLAVSDKDRLRELQVSNPVWEYSKAKQILGRETATVFYGPYSTDFSVPGLYSAVFWLRVTSLPKPSELTEDYILLEIDVNKKLPVFVSVTAGIAAFKSDSQVSRRFIRVSELAGGGWKSFELPFHADGLGEWEFCAYVYNGAENRKDTISKLGSGVRLYFDKVVLHRKREFSWPDA